MSSPNLRIGTMMATVMIGVALVFDGLKALIELITFGFLGWLINPFVNIFAQMTFLFWFSYLGISFLKPGKMQMAKVAGMAIPSFIGLIPWVGDLPYWTSGIVINIAAVYAEDLLEVITPETLGVMGKVLTKFKKRSKGNGLETEKSEIIPSQNIIEESKNTPTKKPEAQLERNKEESPKEEFKRNISEKKVITPTERPRPAFDGIRGNIDKETGMKDSTQKIPPQQPQYQEFDKKSGRLVPVDIAQEDSEDWPIAI